MLSPELCPVQYKQVSLIKKNIGYGVKSLSSGSTSVVLSCHSSAVERGGKGKCFMDFKDFTCRRVSTTRCYVANDDGMHAFFQVVESDSASRVKNELKPKPLASKNIERLLQYESSTQ
jgi:hypothetical protein